MKNKKQILADYAFFDRSGIQSFLEGQARKGWLLTAVAGAKWSFTRMEPRELHYAVAYFPEETADNGMLSDEMQDFLDLCEHTGWEKIGSRGPAQIFKNESTDPVPIETDAVVEIDTIHKSVKKHYLISCMVGISIGLLNACLKIWSISTMPYVSLARDYDLCLLLSSLLITILYGHQVVLYYSWRRKAKIAAEIDGGFVKTRSYPFLNMVMPYAMLITILFGIVADAGTDSFWIAGLSIIYSVAGIKIGKLLNKKTDPNTGSQKSEGKMWGQLLAVILLVGVVCLIPIVPFMLVIFNAGGQDASDRIYEANGVEYKLQSDSIPLTIEDLMEVDTKVYRYKVVNEEESFLMRFYDAEQSPCIDEDELPNLRYRVITVKAMWLYDFCLETLMENTGGYSQVVAVPWGAKQAFVGSKTDSEMPVRWVLCYEDRIVELQLDWEMSEEQMAQVVELLVKG